MGDKPESRREPASGDQYADDAAPVDDAVSEGDDEAHRDLPAAPASPVPAPGEPAGDMWPGVQAARADADENDEVTDVESTSLAPPGKPDGEVDTRR